MPAYVYKCKVCEYTYEKKKRFSDPHDTNCPECSEAVRRVINSVGIVFKGSGFYVNDSKSNNSAAPSSNGTNGSEKADADKGSSEKGEKKGDTDSSSSSSSSDTAKKESKPKESKKSEPTAA